MDDNKTLIVELRESKNETLITIYSHELPFNPWFKFLDTFGTFPQDRKLMYTRDDSSFTDIPLEYIQVVQGILMQIDEIKRTREFKTIEIPSCDSTLSIIQATTKEFSNFENLERFTFEKNDILRGLFNT